MHATKSRSIRCSSSLELIQIMFILSDFFLGGYACNTLYEYQTYPKKNAIPKKTKETIHRTVFLLVPIDNSRILDNGISANTTYRGVDMSKTREISIKIISEDKSSTEKFILVAFSNNKHKAKSVHSPKKHHIPMINISESKNHKPISDKMNVINIVQYDTFLDTELSDFVLCFFFFIGSV